MNARMAAVPHLVARYQYEGQQEITIASRHNVGDVYLGLAGNINLHSVYTELLARKPPSIRSYTVYIYTVLANPMYTTSNVAPGSNGDLLRCITVYIYSFGQPYVQGSCVPVQDCSFNMPTCIVQ
jgi:hypothetical protein